MESSTRLLNLRGTRRADAKPGAESGPPGDPYVPLSHSATGRRWTMFPSPWPALGLGMLGLVSASLWLPPAIALSHPPHLFNAQELVETGAITNRRRPIGYAVFLALGLGPLGETGIVLVHSVAYLAAVVMFFAIATRLTPSLTLALASTAILAFHPNVLLGLRRINDNALNVLLVLPLVALLIGRRAPPRAATLVALGVTLGLSIAVRPPMALFLPLLAGVAMVRGASVSRISVMLGLAAATWMGVNLAGTRQPLFFPDWAAFTLYHGTNPFAREALLLEFDGEPSWRRALEAAGYPVSETMAPEVYRDLSLHFVRENPLQAIELVAIKAWNLFRIDLRLADSAFKQGVQATMIFPSLAWLAALALHLWRERRLCHQDVCFLVFLTLFVLPYALFNSDPRYRLPLDVAFLLDTLRLISTLPRVPARTDIATGARPAVVHRSSIHAAT